MEGEWIHLDLCIERDRLNELRAVVARWRKYKAHETATGRVPTAEQFDVEDSLGDWRWLLELIAGDTEAIEAKIAC